MPVTDFECQIARGQIDRYLGGGLLSPAALGGLEEHLGECAECKSIVAERRAVLLGKLSGEVPTHAVVSMPNKKEENPLIAALRAKSEEALLKDQPKTQEMPKTSPRYAGSTATTAKPVLTKPVMLAGLLAVVLVGMNAMSRANGGKGVMGGKAAESFAADSLASTPPKEKPAPVKTVTKVAVTPAAKVETPKPVPAKAEAIEEHLVETTAVEAVPPRKPVTPAPATIRPLAAKPAVRRMARRKPVVRARRATPAKKAVLNSDPTPRTGVRVYGLDGQPIKP